MAYAVADDIQSEFKDIVFSSSTKVTTAEVTEFIAQTDAIIDGKVGLRYVTPVVGASSLLILKYICIQIVVDRIKTMMEVKSASEELNQKPAPSPTRMAYKMLEDIANLKILLSDATALSSSSGVSSYDADNCIEPTFRTGEDQW